jgi:regulation of enolase protein 1 (concanavalin A-like superfamily)
VVTADAATDFWCTTGYGTSGITATCTRSSSAATSICGCESAGSRAAQYDQARAMVRVDEHGI